MTKRRNTIRNHIIISSVIICLDYLFYYYKGYSSNLYFLGFPVFSLKIFWTDLIFGNVFFFLIYRIIKNKNNEERKKIIRNHTIISLVVVSFDVVLNYFNLIKEFEYKTIIFLENNDIFSVVSNYFILTKLILGNIILLVITWIIKHIKNMKYEGKDIIHNMISDLSLNGIERFLKLTYYVFIFLIINTIIDFIKLINESGEYLTFKHYIYYIFGLFGLFSWLLLVNYVLRTRK